MNSIESFYEFVAERHKIWHRRNILKQPFPWSRDNILNAYRFTNVYRELDKGTIYLHNAVRVRHHTQAELPALYFKVIAYRLLNNPSAFDFCGGIPKPHYNLDHFAAKLREYKQAHGSLFSPSYRTICNVQKGTTRIGAYISILKDWKRGKLAELVSICRATRSYQEFCSCFKRIKHVGDFLAYEIATDLRAIDPAIRNKYTENDWANIGPGAIVGLHYLTGADREELQENQPLCLELARDIQKKQKVFLPNDFPYFEGKELSLRNIEHSLCEYGKYMNTKIGVGKPRQIFIPPVL